MEISLPETCSAETVAELWRSALPVVARLGEGEHWRGCRGVRPATARARRSSNCTVGRRAGASPSHADGRGWWRARWVFAVSVSPKIRRGQSVRKRRPPYSSADRGAYLAGRLQMAFLNGRRLRSPPCSSVRGGCGYATPCCTRAGQSTRCPSPADRLPVRSDRGSAAASMSRFGVRSMWRSADYRPVPRTGSTDHRDPGRTFGRLRSRDQHHESQRGGGRWKP